MTPARRAEVDAYLAEYPEDAERVRAYQAQNLAIKALFDPVLAEPLPDNLHALTVQPLNATVSGKKADKFKFFPVP